MKKIVGIIVVALVLFLGCKKEAVTNFEELSFSDLRTKANGTFVLVDAPREIVKQSASFIDTLGETKLFYHSELLTCRNWEEGYMTPKHMKTYFSYAYFKKSPDVMVLLAGAYGIFFDKMYIISNEVVKEIPVNIAEIKKAEIDVTLKVVRITYNDSWARTGPIPDVTKEFSY